MSRQKLPRFADNQENPLVIEPGKAIYETIKGNWNKQCFPKEQPLVVELACGRGEYTVGLAREFENRNFIGVDIKGSRIWVGAKTAQTEGLPNAAFLRIFIQNLEHFFAPGEISEIWITFPDPRPKGRDERRRLTYPRFLEMYRKLLAPGGTVHLKTDNTFLFDYTLEILQKAPIQNLISTDDLYHSPWADLHHDIKTRFEGIFSAKGETIKYLSFKFTDGDFEFAPNDLGLISIGPLENEDEQEQED